MPPATENRAFGSVLKILTLRTSNALTLKPCGPKPGQRKQFEPVLRAGMEKIRDLRQKHRPRVRAVLLETRMTLCSILNEQQCKHFDELSLPMIPGRDFPGSGRCLQDAPKGEHWRGSGRKRRMEQQETLEHRPYQGSWLGKWNRRTYVTCATALAHISRLNTFW